MQSKVCNKIFTYQTRLKLDQSSEDILSKTSKTMSSIERQLFKDYYQKTININELKSSYIKRFKITARYFNSLRSKLDGKVSSYKKLLDRSILNLKTKINKLKAYIEKITNPFKIHQKKRRFFTLTKKLENLKKDKENNKIRICFGSRKIFKQQFNLEENGFSSHKEWKETWDNQRNKSFFIIGSKDETAGNQTCQLSLNEDKLSLCLRLPDFFNKKHLVIKNISFGYGQDKIIQAIKENEKRKELRLNKKPYNHLGKAINFLFLKDEKSWKIFVSIVQEAHALITKNNTGVIGIDINASHITLAETDRFGNLIYKKKIHCLTYGKNKNQAAANISEAVKEIIQIAVSKQKHLAIEKLDFEKKKLELREKNKKYSRMLSSFAYNQIISAIENKAFKTGIEILKINPAFTSIIGRVKFAQKYGLSPHEAAAFVIARRSCKYCEKITNCLEIKDDENSKSAFFLPVRNRKKHVWSFYSEFLKILKAANVLQLSTKFRSLKEDVSLSDDSIIFQGSIGKLILVKTARTRCLNNFYAFA